MSWERKDAEWPAGETVPMSRKEALQLGWQGGHVSLNPDNETAGVAHYWKHINDDLRLYVDFPFAAKLAFGPPERSANLYVETKQVKKELFDVEFCGPDKQIIRLLAEDEDDAGGIALNCFEFGTIPRPADKKKRRVVYEWRGRQGLVSVKTGKKARHRR
jgi:hypothetical protein